MSRIGSMHSKTAKLRKQILQITDTDLGTIEYRISGCGELKVLVLHGWNGNAKDQFGELGLDTDRYTFIVPSRPGYGNTPLSSFESPANAASLIISLLDKLEIRSFYVIGITTGCFTAVALAHNFSNRIKKLVLESAIIERQVFEDFDISWKRSVMTLALCKVALGTSILFFRIFTKSFSNFLCSQFSIVENQNVNLKLMKQTLLNMNLCDGLLNDTKQDIPAEFVKQITTPTIIVHNKFDKIVSILIAFRTRLLLSNSRLLLCHINSGHLMWLDASYGKVSKEINSFLLE